MRNFIRSDTIRPHEDQVICHSAGAGAASFATAWANPHEKTLANGLRVIVQEDRRAPTAVHMVWYRAGSMDETDGTSGVAHVLEHMMFKGTRTLKPGEFNKRVAAAGGRDNAFTSLDYTAYFQQVPARRLGEMMALEADRMANLVLDAKEFAQEIKVVMEERRLRTEDNPQSLVHEKQMAAAFQAHPYRRPIIGWMNDLENMTAADARDWYRRWYAPNNAYVIVVGDVNKDEVFRLAEKHYGKIPRRALPERKPQTEPAQVGIKRLTVKAPAKLPYLSLAWKVPALRDLHKRPRALCPGDAGRRARRPRGGALARNLVRGAKLAVSAGAGYDATVRGEGAVRRQRHAGGGQERGRAGGGAARRDRARGERRRRCPGAGARAHAAHRRPGVQARFDDGAGDGDRPPRIGRRALARHRYPDREAARRQRRGSAGGGEEILRRRRAHRRRARSSAAARWGGAEKVSFRRTALR
jgi:hypothetical protein